MDEKKVEKMDMAATHLAASGQLHSQQLPGGAASGDQVPSYGTLSKSDQNIRESALYKRILGQSLKQAGLTPSGEIAERAKSSHSTDSYIPHIIPPQDGDDHHHDGRSQRSLNIHGISEEENNQLVRQVAEMAATAAAVAARDASTKHHPRRVSQANLAASTHSERPNLHRTGTAGEEIDDGHTATGHGGGHDAPNWSRTKSAVILLTATVAYAIIAEILVNTVDAVLENVDIDEKFLGITLFALVPNTTEFLVWPPVIIVLLTRLTTL